MCSGSEEGSQLRLIVFVYHSNLGLRVIKKKKSCSFSARRGVAHSRLLNLPTDTSQFSCSTFRHIGCSTFRQKLLNLNLRVQPSDGSYSTFRPISNGRCGVRREQLTKNSAPCPEQSSSQGQNLAFKARIRLLLSYMCRGGGTARVALPRGRETCS